jgi:DNA processing protein
MNNSDLLYYLSFSHFLGIGPVRFTALKEKFGSVEKAYLADKKDLEGIIGTALTDRFIRFRAGFDPVKKLEELKNKNITTLAVDDEIYPRSIKNISDPPICIYIKGNTKLISSNARHRVFSSASPPLSGESPKRSTQKQVSSLFQKDWTNFAIVGTRSPTQYGIQIAKIFSFELTEAGFIIVSGMAYGIDTIVHRVCLEAGGKTIAVLGCGVDIVYPASNRWLYNKIINEGGAVISEFPPGQFVEKGLFIARNRIISALSRGVMIVEGTKDSGSLITARYAAEQGKDVFAPPGPITSDMSSAPNLLLKQGAKLVTSVEDILEEFNMKIPPKKKEDIMQKLNEEEKKLFALLSDKPESVDDLALMLKKSISLVLNTLSVLEINGIVEKNNENKYQARAKFLI